MGAIKSEIYREDLIEFTELLKAIAHPARMRIIEIMMEKADEIVTTHDFIFDIELSQSAISQHVKVLTSVGIISTKSSMVNGRYCQCYEFDYDAIETITLVLNKVLQATKNKNSKEFALIDKYYNKFRIVLERRWKKVDYRRII